MLTEEMIDFKRTQKEGDDLNRLIINLPPGPRTVLLSHSGAEQHFKGSHSNNCDENKFYSYAISLCFAHNNDLYITKAFVLPFLPKHPSVPWSADTLSALKTKPFAKMQSENVSKARWSGGISRKYQTGGVQGQTGLDMRLHLKQTNISLICRQKRCSVVKSIYCS